MSESLAFTELEEGLFGPDGTQVLRRTAGRLVALRDGISAQIAQGLTPADAAKATLALTAISAAERIIIDIPASGE